MIRMLASVLAVRTAEARRDTIESVRSACSSYGYLQVVGHGIPLATQPDVLAGCKALFDLPQAQKDTLSLKNNPARRGYERVGEQILDARALPDAKEGFYLGREVPLEDAGYLRGPNQWPDLPLQAFRTPIQQYHQHMDRLGKTHLARGLGHDTAVLDDFTRSPVVNLKLLHYSPHTSQDERQFGAGEHTDFGAITMLLQQPDKCGLQVFHAASGGWLPIPAIEDVLVINIGDLIARWTNCTYNSTLHRVINNVSGGDRYSVRCFYQGDLSATNPFDPNGTDRETVEQHIRKKFDASYGFSDSKK